MSDFTSLSGHPRIVVTPIQARTDEPLHIRLRGNLPGQSVTLCAELKEPSGRVWRSVNHYTTDSNGMVDLTTTAPDSGTYEGIDAMGLLWSMQMATDVDPALPPATVDQPLSLSLSLEADGSTLGICQVERTYLAPGVRRVVVRENGVIGTLFLPVGRGPFPVVTVVTGSEGGANERRAALYAAHGFAGFALPYFAYEGLSDDLVNIPLELFERAFAWLKAHPEIDGERIAVAGGSRGGELSLLLGATFPQVRAVVAYVPSGLLWGGFARRIGPHQPAWTYGGKPLAQVPNRPTPELEASNAEFTAREEPLPLTPSFLNDMNQLEDLEAVTIAVERTNGAILLISGEDDQMWPCTLLADRVVDRLKRNDFPHPFRHISYPGAGHMILPPYVPTTVSSYRHSVNGVLYALGGTPREQHVANVDSWRQVLDFLNENL